MKIKSEKDFIELIHSKRFVAAFFVVMGVIYAVCWMVLVRNENRIYTLKPEDVVLSDASGYGFNVENVDWEKDEISITEDYVYISGWLVKPGEQSDKVAIKIVLKDLNTGEYFVVPTEVTVRSDVTDLYNDGNEYDYCGFSVKIPYWNGLEKTDYEILAQYDLNDNPRAYVPFFTSVKKRAEELNNA